MYTGGSDELNQIIEKIGSQSLKARLVFDDFTIDRIKSMQYSGGSCNSDRLEIGQADTAYIAGEVFTDKMIENQEFKLECVAELASGASESIPIGFFRVQQSVDDMGVVRFEAYDRMQNFDRPYASNLVYPTDSSQILDELCTMCGVELATPIANPITITDKLNGYTCREVLGYIAGIHGLFACFDRYGKLNLRWYDETAVVKQLKYIWNLNKGQSNFTVNKVTFAKDNETAYVSGSGNTGVESSNPYATQDIADDVMAKIGNFSYRQCEIEMLDDYRIDPWDIVEVTYFDGDTIKVPAMGLIHNFTNGSTTIRSFSFSEVESEYSYKGPMTQYSERTATELLIANKILATKVDAEWVKANTLSADSAVITDLKSNVAKIDTLIFGSASGTVIQTEFSNSVIAQLGEAQIKSAMIESVSASKITAGEIYTNLVKIYGDSNKRLVIADNTIQLSDDSDIVRMQMGEDTSGRYNIIIRNSSEEVIFDAVGVTEKGYHSGSIKNIAVADNANISAGKLNIDSLFSVINDDSSHTLKSSKIYLDSEAQTLDVAFSAMTTNVTNVTNTAISQGTQISAIQGQINSKIWQQDITTAVTPLQADISSLNTKYTSIEQTVGEVSVTVANHTTQIENKADNSTVTAVDNKVTSLTADVNMFKTEVSNTYTTKAEFNSLEIGGKNLVTYNNIVQFGTGSMDKSHFIDSGTIIRNDLGTNGGFRFDSKSCYKPNTNYTLECYMTVLSGTLVNFRLLSGKAIKFLSFTVDGVKYGNPLLANFTEINNILNDKAQHHLIIKYATSATIPEDTGYQYTYFQPNSANAAPIEYKLEGFCLRSGDKALGWSPAPEDTESEITSVKTIATQTADKFNWLVASGTSSTDFTLTDRVASLLSAQFNIDALTTFKNSAESGTSTVIDGGAIKANSIKADSIDVNNLFAQNITATGTITGGTLSGTTLIAAVAEIGAGSTIGGFKVWGDSINNGTALSNTKDNNSTGMGKQGSNWGFWAGNGRFSVTQDGYLYAESGVIGGVTLSATAMIAGDITLSNNSETINNIAVPGTRANTVKINRSGFTFYENSTQIGKVVPWNLIYAMNN